MAIDYFLDLPCEPKRRLGADGLLERLRRLERLVPAGKGAAGAGEALDVGFDLRPVAFHCGRCPGNHAGRQFGCFGSVHFPLSCEAEEWLVKLLPTRKSFREPSPEDARQSEAARVLIQRLRELGIDGREVETRGRRA